VPCFTVKRSKNAFELEPSTQSASTFLSDAAAVLDEGFMSDLFFATPWWLLASLIIVGGVVFWSGNNNQKKNPKLLGIGLVALAIVLKITSFFVETDKEKVTRYTKELVADVQKRDWDKFGSLLENDASLKTANVTVFPNRASLLQGAKTDTENYNPTNVSASITNVEQDATGITVDIDAASEQPASMGMRVPSSWKLIWERDGDDWHLHEVMCLKIANEDVSKFPSFLK
jgi:hypothetical protein